MKHQRFKIQFPSTVAKATLRTANNMLCAHMDASAMQWRQRRIPADMQTIPTAYT